MRSARRVHEKDFRCRVALIKSKEATREEDTYGTLKAEVLTDPDTEAPEFLCLVRFNPTEKDQRRSGIRETVEAIAWLPKQTLNEQTPPITFGSIDTARYSVVVYMPGETVGNTYEIKQKALASQTGDDFLWVTLGINKQ